MAVNIGRSMNAELNEGMTDGSYKKIPRDRSVVNDPNLAARREMSWRYGFEDAPVERRPDTGAPARRAYDDHG